MIKVEIKKYKNNQIICMQGEKTDKLFVLRSGTIKVAVNQEKKITEELVNKTGQVVNRINQPNQTIGEIGLLLNRERSASLVAEGPVELEIISFDGGVNLSEIIKLNKQIGTNILNTVIDRIIHTSKQIHQLKTRIDKEIAVIDKYAAGLMQMKTDNQATAAQIQNLKKSLKSKYDIIRENINSVNRDFKSYKPVQLEENNVLPKKSLFFNETSTNDDFYLLLSGKISILCNNILVYSSDKKHTILSNYSILDKSRPAENYFTFVTNDDTRIKKIAKSKFFEMLDNEPVLYSYLSKILSLLLVNTDKALLELSRKNEILKQIIFSDADSLNNILQKIKAEPKDENQSKLANEFVEDIKPLAE